MAQASSTVAVYAISLTSLGSAALILTQLAYSVFLYSCASLPLVALGLVQNVNGVGVSQALNVFFHSPAALSVPTRFSC